MTMRTISRRLQLDSLVLLLCVLIGCTDHKPVPTPLATCRLSSMVISPTNSLTWTYTADGQIMTNGRQTSDVRPDQYVYDTDGLLLNKITYSGSNPFERHTYLYQQGRLVSDVDYRYARDRNISVQTYEYDADGKRSRVIYKFNSGATVYTETYLFSQGKQTDYILYNGNTGVTTQPYRFENGQIKQESIQLITGGSPIVTDYTYDTAGRLIREDDTKNETYTVYAYIDGRSATSAIPSFKGWPSVALNAKSLAATSLRTKETKYRKDKTGLFYKNSELLYIYTQHASGYPLTERKEYRTYDTTGQLIGQGVLDDYTYTYDNCR